MPFFKTLLVELAPVFDRSITKLLLPGIPMRWPTKTNLQQLEPFGRSRAFGPSGAGEAGMPEDKVMQVSAMADQMLWMPKIRKARATGALRLWC